MNFPEISGGYRINVPPARHQQDNSKLYLIGKVALLALSWYGTIVLESPILAAVTAVIGVSILYDLFSMATGASQPPDRQTYVSNRGTNVGDRHYHFARTNSSSDLPDGRVGLGGRSSSPTLAPTSENTFSASSNNFQSPSHQGPSTNSPSKFSNGRVGVGERSDKPSSSHQSLVDLFGNRSQQTKPNQLTTSTSKHPNCRIVHW
jgi:hypothetical protein